jgi:hypothetical protein
MAPVRSLTIAALLAACFAKGAGAAEIAIADPWIAAAPPTVGINAAYLLLTNNTAKTVTLVGAESPRFARIEMHRSETKDGVNAMRREVSLALQAGQRLSFTPGGLHLMLFSGSPPPRDGEKIPLTLLFADGRRLDFAAEVRPFSPGPPAPHH